MRAPRRPPEPVRDPLPARPPAREDAPARPRPGGELLRAVGNARVQRAMGGRGVVGPEGGPVPEDVASRIHAARGGGRALDPGVQREMEGALGADLAGVRLHTDPGADALSRSLGARAFTTGRDVFFRQGEYAPGSSSGRRLLGHELAHVVQQAGAPVQRALTVGPADDPHEREAHRAAAGMGGAASAAAGGLVQRWDSPEHVRLGNEAGGAGPGAYLTLACHDEDLPQRREPPERWPEPWQGMFLRGDPDQRRALREGLTYGEIVALAGDFYAGFAELNAASLQEIYELIPLIRDGGSTAAQQRATAGRYLALAAENENHFSHVRKEHSNHARWRELHVQAIHAARAGDANTAWALNAFADHYLTDAFSGGHIRTPRSDLMGSVSGNIESKVLHDLDNTYGVDVTNPRGDVWTAYGDVQLGKAENERNRELVLESVRASKQDVADALALRERYPAPDERTEFAAERLVPVPVDPSRDRWTGRVPEYVNTRSGRIRKPDDYTRMKEHVFLSEGPDVAAGFLADDNEIRDWVAQHSPAALARQPVGEKIRMLKVLLSGSISREDIATMYRIVESVRTSAEMRVMDAAVSPAAVALNAGERARLRLALQRRP